MGDSKSDLGFWAIIGFFMALWGAVELIYGGSVLGNVWAASGNLLWGGFLLSIGSYLLILVARKVRM